MLRENKKNFKKCLFCFNSKTGYNKKVKSDSLICNSNKSNIEEYDTNSKPMIKGKEVKYSEAIAELKKIINTKETFHVDGLSCDVQSINKVLNFAEKNKFSISHIDGNRIKNFYESFQKYGASFCSFNEIKNRSDLLIFFNISQDELCSEFFENLGCYSKKKKSIFFFISKKQKTGKYKQIFWEESFFCDLNLLGLNLSLKTEKISKKYNEFKKKFEEAKFPVVFCNIGENNFTEVSSIYSFMSLINKRSRLRVFNFLGSNNSAGFINSCVTKTGFPNSINFTENGPEYEPNEIIPNSLKEYINFQIYVSSFEDNPIFEFFKNNVFVGHPNFKKKKKIEIYIPTKTPGIDCSGLVVRPDGVGITKLTKNINTDYPFLGEVFDNLIKN